VFIAIPPFRESTERGTKLKKQNVALSVGVKTPSEGANCHHCILGVSACAHRHLYCTAFDRICQGFRKEKSELSGSCGVKMTASYPLSERTMAVFSFLCEFSEVIFRKPDEAVGNIAKSIAIHR